MALHTQAGNQGSVRSPRSGRPGGVHEVPWYRRLLFGKPIRTEHQEHGRLRKLIALPVFSSDAISSVAYATQEILLVLGAAGLWLTNPELYHRLTIGITCGIVALLVIVATSYWQTIFAYPSGGGSYIVSHDNLGVYPGLIAAAALLIDYVLTVSVSVASGVQNILGTPVMHRFQGEQVLICLLCIAFIALLNLRGVRESGTVFAIPTYSFIGLALLLIVLGLFGQSFGWTIHTEAVTKSLPAGAYHPEVGMAHLFVIAIILKAFASGCSAMTGTEAVSNGIPAFRKPESRNAALTLMAMAMILGVLFLGISTLAARLGVVYGHKSPAVIDQLAGAVFGKTDSTWRVALYYAMQVSTMAILVVAANTSFADFPRLSAILARDRFMPRQLTNLGDKLVFTNGIVLLAGFAMVLIVVFHGSVDRLIPLYALGVFTAFTLSQGGMVVHWWKERGPGSMAKMCINGVGALCTFVVLSIIIYEKAPEGAWIVIVVAAILVVIFRGIWKHYEFLRSRLTIIGYQPDASQFTNTVLVLVPSLHRGVFPALKYARSLSPDCRGIHIEVNPEDTARLRREWEQYVGEDLPLVILPSPYRSLIRPLMCYVDESQAERPNHIVTVVVPEFVPGKWWHAVLHNANGFLVKYHLSHKPGVIVTNVRYFLGEGNSTAVIVGSLSAPPPSMASGSDASSR
jgi:amino acid transporter